MKNILILIFLTGCTEYKPFVFIPPAPVTNCDFNIQAPINRVGALDGVYFTTPYLAELYHCLPSPVHYAEHDSYRVIYSIKLENVHVNELINYYAISQITNDLGESSNVMLAWYVTLAHAHDSVDGVEIVSSTHGYNCSGLMHHCIVQEGGTHKLIDNYNEIYLNFVVYSGASEINNANLIIEQHYGSLTGYIVKF